MTRIKYVEQIVSLIKINKLTNFNLILIFNKNILFFDQRSLTTIFENNFKLSQTTFLNYIFVFTFFNDTMHF